MNNSIIEALYGEFRDKFAPYSLEFLIAFIIFVAIVGLVYWFWIRKK